MLFSDWFRFIDPFWDYSFPNYQFELNAWGFCFVCIQLFQCTVLGTSEFYASKLAAEIRRDSLCYYLREVRYPLVPTDCIKNLKFLKQTQLPGQNEVQILMLPEHPLVSWTSEWDLLILLLQKLRRSYKCVVLLEMKRRINPFWKFCCSWTLQKGAFLLKTSVYFCHWHS